MHIEVIDEDTGQEDLHEGPTEKHDKRAKEAKEKVAGLMNNQVCIIENCKISPVQDEIEADRGKN